MKLKRLIIILVVIVAVYFSGEFVLKTYLFPFKHKKQLLSTQKNIIWIHI